MTSMTPRVRSFLFPKMGERLELCQDSALPWPGSRLEPLIVNGRQGGAFHQYNVAVADGATQSYMPAEWARELTDGFAAFPTEAVSSVDWERWLASPRQIWQQRVNATKARSTPAGGKPSFSQMLEQNAAAVQQAAAATFVGLRLWHSDKGITWDAWLLGDSCLFYFPANPEGFRVWPISTVADFGYQPDTALSYPRDGAKNPKRITKKESLASANQGDVFILATDATAEWLIGCQEQGRPVWGSIINATEGSLRTFIDQARHDPVTRMKDDDVGIVVVTIGDNPHSWCTTQVYSQVVGGPFADSSQQPSLGQVSEVAKRSEENDRRNLSVGTTPAPAVQPLATDRDHEDSDKAITPTASKIELPPANPGSVEAAKVLPADKPKVQWRFIHYLFATWMLTMSTYCIWTEWRKMEEKKRSDKWPSPDVLRKDLEELRGQHEGLKILVGNAQSQINGIGTDQTSLKNQVEASVKTVEEIGKKLGELQKNRGEIGAFKKDIQDELNKVPGRVKEQISDIYRILAEAVEAEHKWNLVQDDLNKVVAIVEESRARSKELAAEYEKVDGEWSELSPKDQRTSTKLKQRREDLGKSKESLQQALAKAEGDMATKNGELEKAKTDFEGKLKALKEANKKPEKEQN